MSNAEKLSTTFETALDRDAYLHRSEILKLARTVALEERSDQPASSQNPREYMYLLIDTASEAGYSIDQLEAIELLELARDKISHDDRMESNIRDGTWDENGTPIQYDSAVKTGENNE